MYWLLPTPEPTRPKLPPVRVPGLKKPTAGTRTFDKVAYMREYMRRYRKIKAANQETRK